MQQMQVALTAALFKLYDNYKTPLGSHVKCYKSRYSAQYSGWNTRFIVWMEVLNIDTSLDRFGFLIPEEYWDKFKIMIEYNSVPNGILLGDEYVIRMLEKL